MSHSIDDDDQRTRQFHSSAPLHQLIKQKLVIFFAGLMFLGGPAISFCILYFLSPLYILGYQNLFLVPYFLWYVYDSLWHKSQHNGGHRFSFMRNLSIWKAFAAYFPVNIITTATLDPSKTYLMGIHPHGLFSLGAFAAFATESVDVRSKLPGITPHLGTLALNFLFPFTREYLMSLGLVSVARQSFRSVLKKAGNAMIVVIGGAEEVKDAQPGSMKLFFEGRHGFAKEAIRAGAHLVPIISFGENSTYQQATNPWPVFEWIRQTLYSIVGVVLPFIWPICQLWPDFQLFIFPRRVPINIVIGTPIFVQQCDNPTREQVQLVHDRYGAALIRLYDTHRNEYSLYPRDPNVPVDDDPHRMHFESGSTFSISGNDGSDSITHLREVERSERILGLPVEGALFSSIINQIKS